VLKIQKKISYALITLNYLKERNTPTSAREIAQRFNLPQDHVAKVMQRMGRAGIVDSIQGPRGGYTLGKDLETISYYDLNLAVEGEVDLQNCIHSGSCQLFAHCGVMLPIQRLGSRIERLLKEIPVAELLQEQSPVTQLICKE